MVMGRLTRVETLFIHARALIIVPSRASETRLSRGSVVSLNERQSCQPCLANAEPSRIARWLWNRKECAWQSSPSTALVGIPRSRVHADVSSLASNRPRDSTSMGSASLHPTLSNSSNCQAQGPPSHPCPIASHQEMAKPFAYGLEEQCHVSPVNASTFLYDGLRAVCPSDRGAGPALSVIDRHRWNPYGGIVDEMA